MTEGENAGNPLVNEPVRASRTIVFVDVVESVRKVFTHETATIAQVRQLLDITEQQVLPRTGGRLVKSTGDGMLLEFATVLEALPAMLAIRAACQDLAPHLPPEQRVQVSIGAHAGDVIIDARDVYGHSVNLAARLQGIAGPDEIVVSATVRDLLTPFLDADIEDLGECFLKNVPESVRAYRIGPPGPRPTIAGDTVLTQDLRPTIAVVPFTALTHDIADRVVADVLADELIASFSRAADLNVISRLSTNAFRDRDLALDDIRSYLHAQYALTGSYRVVAGRLVVVAALSDTRNQHTVWSATLRGAVNDILLGEDPLLHSIVAAVSAAIVSREIERAASVPLPNLESYSLLMGAIAMMHRGTARDFARARDLLNALIERARRAPAPYAWLGKWHVLHSVQGQAADPEAEAQLALDCTKRALDVDPRCSLALAIGGFVNTNLLHRFDVAEQHYTLALQVNPNESLAWLLRGTLHAFRGEGAAAMADSEHALRLSPLDPLHYFYESLAATAALSAGRYERAVELAQLSLRGNRTHTSTFRALAIAQVQLGQLEAARKTVAELLVLDPALTVSAYARRSPASRFETGPIWANALSQAGVPA